MPTTKDREKRQSIIDACRSMNTLGINQGTSGNISLRHGDGMLITPTSNWRGNITAACRSVRRHCCQRRRSKKSASAWPDTATRTSNGCYSVFERGG
jgi:ribulose-5-phosphate 4-epimerase/fuculose-1-phosphate aldolase